MIRIQCKCECHNKDYSWCTCCQPNPTIEESWKGFEKKVVHPEAGENQRESMKMAFYGGFTQMMLYLEQFTEYLSEEDFLIIISSFRKEYLEFFEDIKNKDSREEALR